MFLLHDRYFYIFILIIFVSERKSNTIVCSKDFGIWNLEFGIWNLSDAVASVSLF